MSVVIRSVAAWFYQEVSVQTQDLILRFQLRFSPKRVAGYWIRTMSSKNILKNILEKELGMDIVLKVPDDEREIKAHRLILAGASAYCEKLFLGPWSEEEKKADPVVVVDMNEISFEVLEMLVSFIYTEEMEFTKKCSVRSAIIAADYLLMDCAIEKLSEYVTQNIQEQTVCEIYQVSDKLSPAVKENFRSYLRKELKNEKIKKGLLELPFHEFKTLVKKDEINPIDEKVAVLTIKGWVLRDWQNRAKHVLDLLKSVAYSFDRSRDNVELVKPMWRICTTADTKGFIVAYLLKRDGTSGGGWITRYFK